MCFVAIAEGKRGFMKKILLMIMILVLLLGCAAAEDILTVSPDEATRQLAGVWSFWSGGEVMGDAVEFCADGTAYTLVPQNQDVYPFMDPQRTKESQELRWHIEKGSADERYWENLLVIDFSKARKDCEEGAILQPLYGAEEFRLAAAGKPLPSTERFRMLGAELTLMYSPEAETTVFTFWGKDDCPDASYDGCAVLGTGGEFLGVFRNGTLSVPADAVKGWFQITDKNGDALKLVRE